MNYNYCEEYNVCIILEYFKYSKMIFDNHLTYIKSYKSYSIDYHNKLLDLQNNYINVKNNIIEKLSTKKTIDLKRILNISDIIPKITTLYLSGLNSFIEDLDKSINLFSQLYKEEISMSLKLNNTFKESQKNVSKKIEEIEKTKDLFIDNMANTEKTISKYYLNKVSTKENNNNNIILEELIKKTKTIERKYLLEVESSKNIEEVFISISKLTSDKIKNVILNMINNLKKSIMEFLFSLKNIYKAPLVELEYYLRDVISSEEDKKLNQIIINSFKKENDKKNNNYITANKYLIKAIYESEKDYNGFTILKDEEFDELSYIKNSKNFTKIQDGLNSTYFLNNEIALLTIKELVNNFVLVDIGEIDLNIESEKMTTKKLTEKLLLNLYKNNEIINPEIMKISEEGIKKLVELLNKHHNRVIFLQELNNFRQKGKHCLTQKFYKIFGDLFNLIINNFKRDNDLHLAEYIIVLSQTYYFYQNNKKEYVFKLIINNEVFKEVNFWAKLLEIGIKKELQQYNEKEINRHSKKENIAFGKIASIINNMIEFDLDVNKVREVIEPKINEYISNEQLKKSINEMTVSQINSKKNNKKNNDEIQNKNNNSINK